MKNLTPKLAIGTLPLALLVMGMPALRADTLFSVGTRAGFNDTASWSALCGQSFASASSTSTNSVGVTATNATGNVAVTNQIGNGIPGCFDNGWNGNFTPGEHLVYTDRQAGLG